MPASYPVSDVLVVLVKEPADFLLAQTQHWYRIPTSTRLPVNLRERQAQIIAFYFPSAFKELRYSVRYYARITDVAVVSRRELFPQETASSRSEQTYYKISFGPLQELARPVVSYRGRRLLFVPTTWAKLSEADEINDLFHDSPLEDVLWRELKRQNLPAERQYLLPANGRNYFCDFAFICAKGNIDVECDGDTYHMPPEAVRYDKARNNDIAAGANWDVLRFTTRNITEELPQTMSLVKQKIDRLGGLHYARENVVRYVTAGPQLPLFEL
ncbi:endonuclease domain-containing protein [uncultured Hymenobacter sp.]|uniref:endonuclease domain-containing protein n=1 Tax=uncultured Hymenobacter sp. TaxID=170016 RepID=UPI0035CC1B6F